jgi:hypothetical protein
MCLFDFGRVNISDGNVIGNGYIVNAADEFSAAFTVLRDTTLGPLYVRLSSTPGLGNSRTFTIRQNGVDTSLLVTLTGTDVEGTDTSTLAVSAGDQISLMTNTVGTPLPTTCMSTLQYVDT